MSPHWLSRGGPALLVLIGTVAAPLAQWIVFFIVARTGGNASAGEFALLFAVATPLVTTANCGLRNGYITLRQRSSFVDFLALRILGVIVAAVFLFVFGFLAQLEMGLVAAVVLMKSADSMTDIWYGRWQYQQRLIPFGGVMMMNGFVTVVFAGLFAYLKFPSDWIVFGSSLGSIATFVAVVVIDAHDIRLWWIKGDQRGISSIENLWRILVSCWQIAAAQVLAMLVVNVPTWAVGAFGTTGDVGRFAAAAYMITMGSLLGSSLNSVVLGRYHADMVSGGASAVLKSVRWGNALVTGLGVFVVIVVWFIGEQLFQLIYGSQFHFTPIELGIIALAAALNPGTYLMNAALLAVNRYGVQLSIVAAALVGSAVAAGLGGVFHLSGFIIGAYCALAGSVFKYVLSWISLRGLVTAQTEELYHYSPKRISND